MLRGMIHAQLAKCLNRPKKMLCRPLPALNHFLVCLPEYESLANQRFWPSQPNKKDNPFPMKIPTTRVSKIDHAKAGNLIRQLRKKHKVSLRSLATKMGKSAPYISDLELGRRNWTEDYFRLAEKSIRAIAKEGK